MMFKRDIESVEKERATHTGGLRPIWKGPIPDRYYYMVKNKKHPNMSAWVVRYSDEPQFEVHIRQVVAVMGGHWSLIESDTPLPVGPNCKLRKHSRIEEIKRKLFESNDRKSRIADASGRRISMEGVPVLEEEVFG